MGDYFDYDDYGMEDEENYMNYDMIDEDMIRNIENYEGEMTPEMEQILQLYRKRTGAGAMLPEFSRASLPDLTENCIVPTYTQAFQMVVSLFVMSFLFQLVCQLSRSGLRGLGIPQWAVHLSGAALGVITLNHFFQLTFFYVAACCFLSYLVLRVVCSTRREYCGLAGAGVVVVFSVSCELFIVEPSTWHKLRGAQIILSMKVISLAMDVGRGSLAELPSLLEYVGYCGHVGTVIFGPWISYTQYSQLVAGSSSPMGFVWMLKVLTASSCAFVCLIYSNCLAEWLILGHSWRWLLAYRDAQAFRFSHYFISFLSDAISTLSGVVPEDGSTLQWNVARPQHIELPRSLVEVVTNWNIPMHNWLKTYVFKAIRPYGIFPAVILTYAASSLLHGLNFQLAAVLLSLGFYSYTEFVFRRRLSRIFDVCIEAKRCKEKCDHKYTQRNPVVIVTNLLFGGVAMFHLAYLGLMFDSSDGHEKGYNMWHTLDKWSRLDFLSHWVAAGTFLLYFLI